MSDEHAHGEHGESIGPQIVSIVACFSITLLFGLPPILSKRVNISKNAVSLSNVFSAGIFLTLGFMLFLPEANELFNNHFKSEEIHDEHGENHEEEGNKQYFPIAFLLALITYVGLFLTNKSHKVQNSKTETELSEVKVQVQQEENALSEGVNKNSNLSGSNQDALSSIMILFTLGFESILDGIAIGLQKEGGEIYEVLFGILIHKWCVAFALGVNLRQKELTNFKSFSIITLFALSTPLGILLGMALAKISSLLTAVLLAISAGVFIYIATGEIMTQEFKTSENFNTKAAFLMLGITTLTGILGAMQGEHAH